MGLKDYQTLLLEVEHGLLTPSGLWTAATQLRLHREDELFRYSLADALKYGNSAPVPNDDLKAEVMYSSDELWNKHSANEVDAEARYRRHFQQLQASAEDVESGQSPQNGATARTTQFTEWTAFISNISSSFETKKFPAESCIKPSPHEEGCMDSEEIYLCVIVDRHYPSQCRMEHLRPYTAKDGRMTLYGWSRMDFDGYIDHVTRSIHDDDERVVAWKKVSEIFMFGPTKWGEQ